MIYRAVGVMSSSSQKELDITFVEFQEQGGKWRYEVLYSNNFAYTEDWMSSIKNASNLSAIEYQALHSAFGHFIGHKINNFIEQNQLQFKTAVIGSYGLTVLSLPEKKVVMQLGDGAAIAAITGLPVVSDFFAMDVALGGSKRNWDLLQQKLGEKKVEININKAVLCAFMGVLRWREEYNVFALESGALRNSIGGALWMGQEA